MNSKEAFDNLDCLYHYAKDGDYHLAEVYKDKLHIFIQDVERLLKHNSIKQTPVLLKGEHHD